MTKSGAFVIINKSIRRLSQAVRQRSAKPSFPGPIPGGASNRKSQPTGLAFSVGGASLFIARAPCACARDPVRIRHPKICKLACKAKGVRIFTEGEIPGILFRKSHPTGMLFCFGGASPFIDRAPRAGARDPVRIRRRQCLPPYSRYINLMPMLSPGAKAFLYVARLQGEGCANIHRR